MKILMVDCPGENEYIESLLNAYKGLGHEVYCGLHNFFYSNCIPDVLHVHWPESLYRWHKILSVNNENIYELIKERLAWFKGRSTKIVYTVHNLKPHNRNNAIDTGIFNLILQNADILVHHCKKSVDIVCEQYSDVLSNDKKHLICPHGDYLLNYKKIDKKVARSRYKIPENKIITINFGTQSPYKNEKFITTVFDLVENKSKYLIFAGRFDHPKGNIFNNWYLKLRNKARKCIKYHDRKYIYKLFQLEEIPYIMACADIAFLGQKEALNSGFIALAATYSIPVVIPDIGCFKESVDAWSYKTYKAGDTASAALGLNSMYSEIEGAHVKSNTEWLAAHAWHKHAEKILQAITG